MINLKFGLWYIDYLCAWSYHPMFPFDIWEREVKHQFPEYQDTCTFELIEMYYLYKTSEERGFYIAEKFYDLLDTIFGVSPYSQCRRLIDLTWLLLRQKITLPNFKEVL